jgi:hypothetical protein
MSLFGPISMDLKVGKNYLKKTIKITFMHNVMHIIPYKISALTVEQNVLHYFRCEPRYSCGPMMAHWCDSIMEWSIELWASYLNEAKHHISLSEVKCSILLLELWGNHNLTIGWTPISLCLIIVHTLTLWSELKITLHVETYISFIIVNCTS